MSDRMIRAVVRIRSETLPVNTSLNRFVVAKNLIRALVSFHRGYFIVAVSGAAVFATGTVVSSYGVKLVIDDVILPAFGRDGVSFGTWFVTSLIVVGIGVVRACGVVVRRSFAGKLQWATAETLANRVLRHVMSQPAYWHRSRMTGDVAARAGVDTDAAVAILAPLPFSTSIAVLLVVAGTWLIVTDVWLGLFATLVFPAMLVMNVLYQRKVDRFYRSAQDELGELSEAAHESFDGVLVVKAFGAEERETERLAVISRRLQTARTRAINLRSTFEALIDATPSLVNVTIIGLGALRIRSGDMTVGDLSSFVYLFTLVTLPLRIVSYLFSELPHSLSGWDRVQQVLREPLSPTPRSINTSIVERSPTTTRVMVEMEHVFAGHGSEDVVSDVNLRVEQGDTLAIVGATGSGKTTLLQVIAGLIPIRSGSMVIGTTKVGLVFQEAFLFSESLRYNLSLGGDTDSDTLWKALEVACAAEFVREMGVGLDAELGERGVSLSGGQRQRLALARALALGCDLLLLDDTTSALDPTTDEQVLRNLGDFNQDLTTILVASRPSTIALARSVLYLDSGRIAAHARHTELLATNVGYRTLISAFEHDRSKDAS